MCDLAIFLSSRFIVFRNPKSTMQTNQQEEEEEEDDCPICNETLASKVVRMTCCGKGTHIKCRNDIYKSSMSDDQKGRCVMCRTKHAARGSKEHIDQLRRWAEKRKAWAQFTLGCRYHEGVGVDQSYQQAAELYVLAANQGYASAQYHLGILYAKGQGVDQSYERAAEYWEAAAQQGMAEAQFNLGALYFNGQGVERSNESGREWMIKAAEKGDEKAIKQLQIMDKNEGRTTPSFTPPKQCSTCDAPKTSTHKLRNCKCKSTQYCNAKCQKTHWKIHKQEHRRLCNEMELTNTEGEMKDEVVEIEEKEEEEEEQEERKETTTADSQQHEKEEDVCPVCIEPLQKDPTKFVRYTCCSKGIHIWCREGMIVSSLSYEQKTSCPLCRAKFPISEEEMVKNLRPWVEKGKAWAQSMLGQKYRDGLGVDQSYQHGVCSN